MPTGSGIKTHPMEKSIMMFKIRCKCPKRHICFGFVKKKDLWRKILGGKIVYP